VLHVVATDQRRGAELFAAALVRASRALDCEQHVAVVRPADGDHVRFDAPTALLTSRPKSSRLAAPRAARRLRTVIEQTQPTVVQVHGGEALKVAMAAWSGLPVVYRRIGGVPPWLERGPRRWVYGRMMRRAVAVVTVADALREETIRVFGLAPASVVTIPNAVDPADVRPRRPRAAVRAELGIGDDAPVTVSVGALVAEKDPVRALEILEPFLRAHRDVVHLVVGGGPLRDELNARAAGLGIGERVRCLGPRTDVGDLLGASDVVLFASSPGAMEGMPGSLIESGLCRRPAVVFDVAGAREVVEDGVTGFVVPWGDDDGFRERIAKVLEDPGLREAMGEAAAQRCAAFDIRAVAPRYLSLYREVGR
jgi:glycosyltransferase involved in cell wall biosynthesis